MIMIALLSCCFLPFLLLLLQLLLLLLFLPLLFLLLFAGITILAGKSILVDGQSSSF